MSELTGLESYVPDGRRAPNRGLVAGAIVAVVALLAAGFAVITLRASSGADSPEDAVRRLVTAVENEDVLGALEVLVPAERDAVREPLIEIVAELKRLGITDDRADLNRVPGVDLDVQDLRLDSTAVAAGITSVRVTGGRLAARFEKDRLPIGPVLDKALKGETAPPDGENEEHFAFDPEPVEIPETAETDLGKDLVLATVEVDGKWYVSLGYTIAEAVRRDSGKSVPVEGHAVRARGAASPEDAVRELAEAGIALDIRRAIELSPPGEAAALHRYAPLFLEDAEKAVAETKADGLVLSLRDLRLATRQDGDVATVTVEGFHVEATSDGEKQTWDFDGKCMVATEPGRTERFSSCDRPEGAEDSVEAPWLGRPHALALSAVRDGGSWYVSPIRTWLGMSANWLRAMERSQMERVPAWLLLSSVGTPAPLAWFLLGGFRSAESEVVSEPGSVLEYAPSPTDEAGGPQQCETVNNPDGSVTTRCTGSVETAPTEE